MSRSRRDVYHVMVSSVKLHNLSVCTHELLFLQSIPKNKVIFCLLMSQSVTQFSMLCWSLNNNLFSIDTMCHISKEPKSVQSIPTTSTGESESCKHVSIKAKLFDSMAAQTRTSASRLNVADVMQQFDLFK